MTSETVVYIDNDDFEVFAGEEDIELYAECNSEITVTIAGLSEQIAAATAAIGMVIDGNDDVITPDTYPPIYVPFACRITAATLLADQSGSIVVDLLVDSLANYPPLDADSITGATPMTISAAEYSQDISLSDWTTLLAAGSVIRPKVVSCSGIQQVTIMLTVVKS